MTEEKEVAKQPSKGVSRRQFIAGTVGGVVVGAVAGGVIGSLGYPTIPASVSEPWLPSTWDYTADVVVVGFGGAGGAAAIRATDSGSKVIVLERLAATGGTTALAGGWIWLPNNPVEATEGYTDSRADGVAYCTRAAEGQASDALISAFLDRGSEMVQWIEKDVPLTWTVAKPSYVGMMSKGDGADYHPEWPGGKPGGRSLIAKNASGFQFGAGLMKTLLTTAQSKGIQVMTSTPATALVQNQNTKEILGVKALSGVTLAPDGTYTGGTEIYVKANLGVILTAGGYGQNPDMVKAYLRGPSLTTTQVGDWGDGIKMGEAIGAHVNNTNLEWGMPVAMTGGVTQATGVVETVALAGSWIAGMPGALVVNKYGKRFYNEAGPYAAVKRAFDFYDTRYNKMEYENMPAYMIVPYDYVQRYGFYGLPTTQKTTDTVPSWMYQANSISELAGKIGVDPTGLAATIQTFNGYVQTGLDLDFERGQSVYDQSWAGDPSFKPNPTLGPVSIPPFYAVQVMGGNIGTCGGLEINEKAQVLDTQGNVIPRLYAAGNNSGLGAPGVNYGGGGGTIGPAMIFGYIAATDVVTLKPWG